MKKSKFQKISFVKSHIMIRYANFDNYSIKFEGGDTFCVKSQITENDSILKYMRYREKQQKRVIVDGL